MRDLLTLFLHLVVTVARLVGPGGARSIVAESLLVKQQLLVLSRPRRRAPPFGHRPGSVRPLVAVFESPAHPEGRRHSQVVDRVSIPRGARQAQIFVTLYSL